MSLRVVTMTGQNWLGKVRSMPALNVLGLPTTSDWYSLHSVHQWTPYGAYADKCSNEILYSQYSHKSYISWSDTLSFATDLLQKSQLLDYESVSSCERLQSSWGGRGGKINASIIQVDQSSILSYRLNPKYIYIRVRFVFLCIACGKWIKPAQWGLITGRLYKCTAPSTYFQHIYNESVTWEFDVQETVHRDKFS